MNCPHNVAKSLSETPSPPKYNQIFVVVLWIRQAITWGYARPQRQFSRQNANEVWHLASGGIKPTIPTSLRISTTAMWKYLKYIIPPPPFFPSVRQVSIDSVSSTELRLILQEILNKNEAVGKNQIIFFLMKPTASGWALIAWIALVPQNWNTGVIRNIPKIVQGGLF